MLGGATWVSLRAVGRGKRERLFRGINRCSEQFWFPSFPDALPLGGQYRHQCCQEGIYGGIHMNTAGSKGCSQALLLHYLYPFPLCPSVTSPLHALKRYQNACPAMSEWKVSNQTKLKGSRACRKPTGVETKVYIGVADFHGRILTAHQNEDRKVPVTLGSWRRHVIASQKVMP